MDIKFGSTTLEKACNNWKRGVRKFGASRAMRVRQRLDDLRAAITLEDMRLVGGCHELKGNRRGQLAVRLDGGYRLVFEACPAPGPIKPGGGLDWKAVRAVKILSVEDYHD